MTTMVDPIDVGLVVAGGTITSEQSGRGWRAPVADPGSMLRALAPAGVRLNSLISVTPDLSENFRPTDWVRIGEAVLELFRRHSVRGVVVTHGTDTLEYTAAALSLGLGTLPGPVCFTGAMRPLAAPDSDGPSNLRQALAYAANGQARDVCVVIHNVVHPGTHSTKREAETSSRSTERSDTWRGLRFTTAHRNDLAHVLDDGRILETASTKQITREVRPELDFWLDGGVTTIVVRPGLTQSDLLAVGDSARAVIILGYGTGTAPTGLHDSPWIPFIQACRESAVPAFLTSQHWGVVRPDLYESSSLLVEAGAVPLFDMTPTMAYVKVLWSLVNPGAGPSAADLVGRVLTNRAGEISYLPPRKVTHYASRYR